MCPKIPRFHAEQFTLEAGIKLLYQLSERVERMSLDLIYISNIPEVARIAEMSGVNRIMIDLETLGKEERQKNMNTVKSHHNLADVHEMSKHLTSAELMVRVNPWNPQSPTEIEQVIAAGADRLMLPMWKTAREVEQFLTVVNQRVQTTLLLETKEAVECLDEILDNPLIDEVYIGLNDLHLSYGLTFMFELLSNGVVEKLCHKLQSRGIPYGFGGIARIGEGLLPAERIVMEHYRLGSTKAILSRSFCNAELIKDLEGISLIFSQNVQKLRSFEAEIVNADDKSFSENRREVAARVNSIVARMKEKTL